MKQLLGLILVTSVTAASTMAVAADRPNILWITSEDNGPHLGAYGDTYADTPNLDALAQKGLRYLRAWSNAPVCAPARTAIIMGMYPTSLGAQHMRSQVRLPDGMAMFPQLLLAAGYYCTNNSKEDYNVEKPGIVWDESSGRAHWNNRPPDAPFFAVFNHTVTHESQIRRRPHTPVHDPAGVRVPAYHPDTEAVRRDWAQYYDKMTEMDRLVGENLRELAEAGLEDDTIVFYYGDHGVGLPRSKRFPYDSGLRVPLIVYIPEKFQHLAPENYAPGASTERLASFVDLAPTVLSLAGIEPPEYMQGHALMGEYEQPPRAYMFGFRDRMDERYDLMRVATDGRYIYIRNYMPHRPYGQHVSYMFETPTTQDWKRLYDEGSLELPQMHFWEPKPAEELYDLREDPDEVRNLVGDPRRDARLDELRGALQRHLIDIHDLGFLPEPEMHRRQGDTTLYELANDPERYPLARILEVANLAGSRDDALTPSLLSALGDDESAVRYWAVLGFLIRGQDAVRAHRDSIRRLLDDPNPSVRIAAAETLGRYGTQSDREESLEELLALSSLEHQDLYTAVMALNALDNLNPDLERLAAERIKDLPTSAPDTPGKLRSYIPRLVEKILEDAAQQP